ncbi:MAG: serine hydrolase [Gemmatimonadota bacterium]
MRRLIGLILAPLVTGATLLAAQTVETAIAKELDGLKAKSSFYAKQLKTGKTIEIRADQPMNTLSVIKIPVMIQAFKDAEAGKLNLATRYTIKPEDRRRGSGLLQTFDVGLSPTYRDLIEQMIITSDNTATDLLIKTVGLPNVNKLLAAGGYKDTRLKGTTGELFREVWIRADPKNKSMSDAEVFDKGFPTRSDMSAITFKLEGDSTKWLGRTTAREIARLIEEIYSGKFASKEHSAQMIDIMKRQFYSSRLPQRLAGVEIAHKTGDWPPFAGNDVGIIFAPSGPIVVAVFTNQNTGSFFELEAAEGRIAEHLVKDWK